MLGSILSDDRGVVDAARLWPAQTGDDAGAVLSRWIHADSGWRCAGVMAARDDGDVGDGGAHN